MKTVRNILIAFILNLSFSILEFIGGSLTGSVAIVSDAIHDLGDACSIGVSYFLEKKSKKKPDSSLTYGYGRYSVIGSLFTTTILLIGSIIVIYNAIIRLFNPVSINYDGMIIFAIFGVIINFLAAYFTRSKDSLNQKAVNLHMLEDVLGWIVVLIGSIIMKFTNFSFIDPIMSIGVSVFILIETLKNLKETIDLFLEKTPNNIDIDKIKEHLLEIEGVEEVHHIHIWSLDGNNNYATLHVVSDKENSIIKSLVKEELKEHGIGHSTIEIEKTCENCEEKECKCEVSSSHHHHHH